jgi:hypothetical protein
MNVFLIYCSSIVGADKFGPTIGNRTNVFKFQMLFEIEWVTTPQQRRRWYSPPSM